MMDQRIRRRLDLVASRFRQLRLWTALAGVWLLSALVGAVVLGLNWQTGWYYQRIVLFLVVATLLVAAVCAWSVWKSVRDYRWLARRVEVTFPQLGWSLLAAVEQRPELPGGRFGFLQELVIREALHHGYRNPWGQAVPLWRLLVAHAAHLAALAALVGVLFTLTNHMAPHSGERDQASPALVTVADVAREITVQPGDTEVERGTSLLVMARFRGPLPAEATLVYENAEGQVDQLPMSKSLDDPVFGRRILSVDEPLTYRVEFAQQTSDTYHVSVFDYPELVRADAQLEFPKYTSLEPRLVQDVRHVSAVEGTELTLVCHLNKKVNNAQLREDEKPPIPLVADDRDARVYRATLKLDQSRRFRLKLVDDQGRANQQPAELVIKVAPNRPPDLKLALPARDVQVSPLEELELAANAWDDFGLSRFGVSYALAGQTPQEQVLRQAVSGKQRVDVRHVVALEQLDSEPDQLLSYHFWAEDTGPDGQLRRISSDMFFAEVRPFEEVFRQGQAPPGGDSQQGQQGQQGGGAQQAQQLAEMQKEIINATWKLIRRERADPPSADFLDDLPLIVQSQASAMDRASSLGERIEDPASQEHLIEVRQNMQKAVQYLISAHKTPSIQPLPEALASEQAAYQALLRLRAREHRVVRGRQPAGARSGSSSSGRAQQQLQQLQLTEDENRYETQRAAQSQTDQADRETRQVLNRLRELARRQNDLNQRLKQLQSALEEARTEPEREELRRQLKRLRDQQQEMLRDTDQLKARMDRPQNQESMAEARQQLDQTRDNLRRASEALEQGMVSRAAAAGTRAERQLDQLRQQFRRQASGQFDEQMRQMRDDARQLEQTQEDVAQRLAELADLPRRDRSSDTEQPDSDPFTSQPPDTPAARDDSSVEGTRRASGAAQSDEDRPSAPPPRRSPAARSLRSSVDRNSLDEDLQSQQQRLDDLGQRMRQVILDAEQSEPLLADQLYDTLRTTQPEDLDQRFRSTRRSLKQGFLSDSLRQGEEARQGIQQLRKGIENAAESVLGDETEALRRVRDELTRLAEELEEELHRNLPPDPDSDRADDPARPPADGQPSQDRPRQAQGQPPGPSSSGQSQRPLPSQGPQSPGPPRESGRPQPASPPSQSPPQGDDQRPQPPSSDGSARGGTQASGQRPSPADRGSPGGGPGRAGGLRDNQAAEGLGGFEQLFDDRPRSGAPIAGADYLPWSDRLRDVEEMVEDPQLRAEAARIRDRAKGIRIDLKRHSKPPNWELVRLGVFEPLVQLRDRVAEQLILRSPDRAMVPIDRDPVPPKYAEDVRRYYERLGSGK